MRQKSRSVGSHGEKVVKDIRRATRKQYSAEEKIRIVLDGLKGEESVYVPDHIRMPEPALGAACSHCWHTGFVPFEQPAADYCYCFNLQLWRRNREIRSRRDATP